MARKRKTRELPSILSIFIDPLFGAFGAFLFIFLMVILMIGVAGTKPIINTQRLPNGTTGENYELWLSAQGGTGDYHWALLPGQNLPGNMTLDTKGYLQGIPELNDEDESEEEFTFEVELTALKLQTKNPEDSKTRIKYKLLVLGESEVDLTEIQPVRILTQSPLPNAIIGEYYNVTLAATGGVPPYRWRCTEELPGDLTLDSKTGRITGYTYDDMEEEEFVFQVTDSRPQRTNEKRDTRSFEFSIHFPSEEEYRPQRTPPEILTTNLPDAVVNQYYNLSLAASGGNGNYQWKMAGTLPDGLGFSDGRIFGIPKQLTDKETNLTVQCQSQGYKKTIEYTLAVAESQKLPPLKSPKWFVLGIIFVISWLIKTLWKNYCFKEAAK